VEKDHLAFRYTCLDWLRGLAWNDKVGGGRRGMHGMAGLID